mgnify:CR=1 FL=1
MIQLIPAGPEDAGLLSSLGKETYLQAFEHTWKDKLLMNAYINRTFGKEVIGQQLSEPGVYYFMVNTGNEITGYLKFSTSREICYLNKLYFLKHATGKGAGAFCLNFLAAFCRQRNILCIELEVLTDNTQAIHFYHRFGFRKTGTHENYSDKNRAPLLVMQKHLV